MSFPFSKLKFYDMGSGDTGGVEAFAYFPNGFGAYVVQFRRPNRFSDRGQDTYSVEVLEILRPHPKGRTITDVIVTHDTPVTDESLVNQSRRDVERILDQIAALPARKIGGDVVDEMIVAIYGASPGGWIRGGALYGGTTSAVGEQPRYWFSLRQEREPHALFHARRVPRGLAMWVADQGTPNQHFSDGYEGLDAIRPYLDREPFYESPEEWAAERDDELDEEEEREEED